MPSRSLEKRRARCVTYPQNLAHGTQRLCIGWADAYYLPASALPPFGTLARAFAAAGANAELALPTMLHMLTHAAASDAVSSAAGLRRLPCWGFCCSTTGCPELLARYACGHRMSLADARVRAALATQWSVP